MSKHAGARMLASDLDGTLIAPPESSVELASVAAFCGLVETNGLRLAYVTGRHLALARKGIRESGLPHPEALGCDVGTTLYWYRGGDFLPDRDYEASIRARAGGIGAQSVRNALAGIAELRLQAPENQAEFKISYVADAPLQDALVQEIEGRLDEVGRARLVVSVDSRTGQGLLDVLPEGIGKASAVNWLRERLDLPEAAIFFAGDSGNDRDALLLPSPSIVVSNTPEALIRDLKREAQRLGMGTRIYFASSPYASGVVEGLRHFGF